MAVKFNPFTGQLQIDEKGSGGGSSVIEGEVDTYNDLPLDGSAALNSSWLVRTASGSWFTGGSKPAGIYVRVNTAGSSRDNDYVYAGLLPSAFSDSELKIYDETDSTKTAQFQLSGIATGQNRVVSLPDKNITLDDSGDSRTPTAHAASHAAGQADELFDQSLNQADSPTFASVSAAGGVGTLQMDDYGLVWEGSRRWSVDVGSFLDSNENAALELSNDVSGGSANISYAPIDFGGASAATNAATTRTNLGLGTAAVANLGTGASDAAYGNHTHTQLHDRSHAITSTSDHTAGNHKVFYSDGSGQVQELALGSNGTVLTSNGATSAPSFAAASGGVGGGSGSVDNAIIRAQGTGGSEVQSSALSVDDAVVPFSITGDASTDIITATGHNFTANQGVRFPTLTGGSGLTAATTTYFVRDISGDTFKVSTTSGGAAVNFTTNVTAGTVIAMQANVAIRNNSSETTSAIVLTPKGTNGAFIVGEKQDGTITGGNPRGNGAIDICTNVEFARTAATQVASGTSSTICGGSRQTASGSGSGVFGGADNTASNSYSVVCGGITNTASGDRSAVVGGRQNTASGTHSCVVNSFNTASGIDSFACGSRAGADRAGLLAHASGFFSLLADAQRIRAVLRCKTTTNAAVEMALDGSTTYLTIPSGKVIYAEIRVVGTKSDGSAVATYTRQYAAKNVAGTSSEVYAAVTIGTDNAASTSLEVATVDAGDYIRIRPTGIASETWRWVASVDAVEVAYGT